MKSSVKWSQRAVSRANICQSSFSKNRTKAQNFQVSDEKNKIKVKSFTFNNEIHKPLCVSDSLLFVKCFVHTRWVSADHLRPNGLPTGMQAPCTPEFDMTSCYV